MSQLTRHFAESEILGSPTADRLQINNLAGYGDVERGNIIALLTDVEYYVRWWSGPMRITSGYRSEALNKALGGAPDSYHRQGLAIDFTARSLAAVHDLLGKYWGGGLGYYPFRRFIHLDGRHLLGHPPARWEDAS